MRRPVSSPAARLVTHARAGRQPASARRGSQFRTAWCPARHCARANGALAASSEAPQVVYDESAEKPDELGQLGRQIKVPCLLDCLRLHLLVLAPCTL